MSDPFYVCMKGTASLIITVPVWVESVLDQQQYD